MSNAEVLAALRVVGAVARADGKITDEERAFFRTAVTEFQPTLDDGTSVEALLTTPSDLDADLVAVANPAIQRALFEMAYAMSTVDGAATEENAVLGRIRTVYAVPPGEKSAIDDMLAHNDAMLAVAPTLDDGERAARVKAVIQRRAFSAALLGAVPVPLIGDIGVLLMLSATVDEICTLWGQPLTGKDKWARFGAIISLATAQSAAHSLIKMIPVWGSLAGAVGGAIGSYVIVGAMGRSVDYHFRQGGQTTAAELRKVFTEQKSELKKSYEADKAKVEAARDKHADALAALAKQLEAKEISAAEYQKKVDALVD